MTECFEDEGRVEVEGSGIYRHLLLRLSFPLINLFPKACCLLHGKVIRIVILYDFTILQSWRELLWK